MNLKLDSKLDGAMFKHAVWLILAVLMSACGGGGSSSSGAIVGGGSSSSSLSSSSSSSSSASVTGLALPSGVSVVTATNAS